MNEQQHHKWKADTYNALVASGIYDEIEAQIIIDWFDGVSTAQEREWFGDGFIEVFYKIRPDVSKNTADLVYKSLTSRVWFYADKILMENQND